VRGEQVITPEHPLWMEFLSRLSRAPICRDTTAHAREALASLGNVDVDETLRTLAALGGLCDCAIEFDIAPLPGARVERVEGAA
jgi:hypothetical protein